MPYSNIMSLSLGIGLGSAISIPNPAPPVVNYVARLDGVSQYWQLSEAIIIPQGAAYKIYIDTDLSASNGDVVQTYMGSGDPNTDFWWYRNGTDVKSCIVRFFNSEFVSFVFSEAISGVVSVESDGSNLTIESNGQRVSRPSSMMLDGFSISLIGYRGYYAYAKGVMKDFKVEINGVLTHSIPLTNREQGATQLATVGNVNATMPNYTPDVWEVYSAS